MGRQEDENIPFYSYILDLYEHVVYNAYNVVYYINGLKNIHN